MADFRSRRPSRALLAGTIALSALIAGAPATFAQTQTGLSQDAALLAQASLDRSRAYLSARAAVSRNDIAAAALFFRQAAEAGPEDGRLARNAIYFSMISGEVAAAVEQLRQAPGGPALDALAYSLRIALAVRDGDYDAADALIDTPPEGVRRQELVAQLMRAWTARGRGDVAQARQVLFGDDGAPQSDPDPRERFALHNMAMIELAAGSPQAAVQDYALARDGAQDSLAYDPEIALGAAAASAAAGDAEEAEAILARGLELGRSADLFNEALENLRSGRGLQAPMVSATDGVAGAFRTLARAIGGEDELAREALIYGQLALFLRPDEPRARLLVGDLQRVMEQPRAAAATYAGVSAASVFAEDALTGQVRSLRAVDDHEAALAAIDAHLADAPDPSVRVSVMRAEILQLQRRYEECAVAYRVSLEQIAEQKGGDYAGDDWLPLFGHGICLERLGRWPEAEARLRDALEVRPNAASVLNYLGYSMLEKGGDFEEALDLIRQAVAERPDSGHIVDSLGWGLYRIGRYEEAVIELQKAVELAPTIAVINDHLGDALWKVGRKMEARFQWKRALSLEDTEGEVDRERVEAKLRDGLDAVLEREAGVAEETRVGD